MVCVIVGYSGSQRIVKASKYLTNKYLPPSFHTIYLNYTGHINEWSDYIADFLSYLTDEHVILALDDYFIADYIDMAKFNVNKNEIGGDVVCIKLCKSTLEEHLDYPVTTQWCIWNREYLISLLQLTTSPWNFEIEGSKLFNLQNKKCLLRTCLDYFTNSSISSRWEGVRLDGLKQEDIDYIKNNNLINE